MVFLVILYPLHNQLFVCLDIRRFIIAYIGAFFKLNRVNLQKMEVFTNYTDYFVSRIASNCLPVVVKRRRIGFLTMKYMFLISEISDSKITIQNSQLSG
jgi:hypothetical protein